MGKGRRPCCDKARVKRGPWSQAEDYKLVSFIQKHGHNNWRALPKLAGLARCGKSCRLRWVNYLRPDLKRGYFTPEEEETIIKLHEALGNKWSKIASHFPGRTDNEIKNVWNTHLKKRKEKFARHKSTIPRSNFTPQPPLISEVHEESNKHQVLAHQASPSNEMVENSSSSITCGSQSSSFDPEISNFDPGFNHDALNATDVQNVNDKDEICGGPNDQMKGDLLEELIEIPFEPDLDIWDMLSVDGDSNSASEVQSKEQLDHETLHHPMISENDKNDDHVHKESSESWWWLVYLENELGLDH